MSIQGMREWVKSHRVLIGILLGLIVVSLLITYSVGAAKKTSTAQTGNNTSDIASYENIVAEKRTAYESNKEDYTTNYELASALYDLGLATVYEDYTKAVASFTEAADYYVVCLELAPADLNDLGRAQLYVKAANCLSVAGENDKAKANYDEAVKLAPGDFEVGFTYAQHLAGIKEYDAAIEVLNNLIANSTDQSIIDSANSLIEEINTVKAQSANDTEADEK